MPDREEEEERRLVARCVAGEPAAWEAMVRLRAPALFARAAAVWRSRCGRPAPPADLEEIVQDVFIRLARDRARGLRMFQWKSSLSGYLSAVAARSTLDRIRREARERSHEVRRGLLDALSESGHRTGEWDAEEVERALQALSERHRLAIRMRYWEGLTPDRIAGKLGVGERQVRNLLAEALEDLRRELENSP